MKKALILSIVLNILCVLAGGYIIQKKGGITYLKLKFQLVKDKGELQSPNAYYLAKTSIFEIMPNDTSEIIFLGNSITDYCDWYELFGNANIKNRGIGGDIIRGVIDRLDEITQSNPKKIFIMIGINDLGKNRSVSQILSDYDNLLMLLNQKSPNTKFYIQSMLPTDNRQNLQVTKILEINNGIQKLAMKYKMTYVGLFDLFKTNENTLDAEYTYDGLHLNGKGYLIWKGAIEDYVNK